MKISPDRNRSSLPDHHSSFVHALSPSGVVFGILLLCVGCGEPKGDRNEPSQPARNQAAAPAPQVRPNPAAAKRAGRPNILLISLDTVRADHLSCYGYGKQTSPAIDRFAAKSIRFAQCRAQAPWTLPSHMSLFTSMLPSANGVDNLNKILPPETKTLAQLLQDAGYQTAALVNNGQMRAHWGFDRGFGKWQEFEVDTPEGNCEQITAAALDWLRDLKTGEPYFLFLHYYDAHDPYEAAEPFRRRFGVELTGEQCRELAFAHRFPDEKLTSVQSKHQLIAAYDAEIAWLDHELGRLLAQVSKNTIVVIFSDHGEAFKEHGWMLHGATLYEEEVRVPLVVRMPGVPPAVVDTPVMLLDVAPTILAATGVTAPAQFQGSDLGSLAQGGKAPQRLIASETKAVLEGQYLLSAAAPPLKAIYSLFDGRFALYKLPDEQADLAAKEPDAARALFEPLRQWISSEQFWMVHAAGPGDFEATIEVVDGRFGTFIPVNLTPDDDFQVSEDGNTIHWRVVQRSGAGGQGSDVRTKDEGQRTKADEESGELRSREPRSGIHQNPSPPGRGQGEGNQSPAIGNPQSVKSLFFQTADAAARLRVNFRINGAAATGSVYVGADETQPAKLPLTVSAKELRPLSPVIEKRFQPARPGYYLFLHRSDQSAGRPAHVKSLDAETLEQLKSLGYVQ